MAAARGLFQSTLRVEGARRCPLTDLGREGVSVGSGTRPPGQLSTSCSGQPTGPGGALLSPAYRPWEGATQPSWCQSLEASHQISAAGGWEGEGARTWEFPTFMEVRALDLEEDSPWVGWNHLQRLGTLGMVECGSGYLGPRAWQTAACTCTWGAGDEGGAANTQIQEQRNPGPSLWWAGYRLGTLEVKDLRSVKLGACKVAGNIR